MNLFKRMLLEPQNCGKDPKEIFENAVAWLLSMAGFTIVHLGVKVKTESNLYIQTDRLNLENNYQVGAADILAYKDNNAIFIIDCDLKGNDIKKIQDLIEVSKHFQSIFKECNLRIIPVLCSPRDLVGVQQAGIVLFNNYRINQMLEFVVRGKREKARSSIDGIMGF